MNRPPFGERLRHWRSSRNLSQLELALEADVSARHIAFLETGRSRPSREMVLHLCDSLRLPLRCRNELLLDAGFAPAFSETGLDGAALQPIRAALSHMMTSHAPYPALICDRQWMLVEANPPAQALLAPLQGAGSQRNVIRLVLESSAARRIVVNWPDLVHDLASRLRLELRRSGGDAELLALLREAEACLKGVERQRLPQDEQPFVPVVLDVGETRLSLISMLAEFGTPRDITVGDLRIELFFPGDQNTAEFFRRAF